MVKEKERKFEKVILDDYISLFKTLFTLILLIFFFFMIDYKKINFYSIYSGIIIGLLLSLIISYLYDYITSREVYWREIKC